MTDEAELARISSSIHDHWFDLDAIVRDPQASELRILVYPSESKRGRFGIWRSRAPVPPIPEPIGDLVIRQVVDVRIDDGAEIQWFDVGGLVYDATRSCVTLRSNFPLEITIRVQELDVELRRRP